MSSPFVAEIRIFAGNFAPRGWATCDGQLLPISQNTALFSLLGTMYGGDGKSNFALPNLNGAAPLQQGQGPGLSQYSQGEQTGTATITLLQSEIPPHPHNMVGDTGIGDSSSAQNRVFGAARRGTRPAYYSTTATTVRSMNPQMIAGNGPGWSGTATPVSIMQPFLAITYIIAMQGIYPPRG